MCSKHKKDALPSGFVSELKTVQKAMRNGTEVVGATTPIHVH
jgi:hypothetical protein